MLAMLSALKRNKSFKLVISAIIMGILAALLGAKYLDMREAYYKSKYRPPEADTVSVVVAKADLHRGTVIDSENMAMRKIPRVYVHDQAITPDQFGAVQGRKLIEPLREGRVLSKPYIAGAIIKDFSDILVVGRRAATIQVDEISSISGMLEPGNRVDLYVTLPARYVGGGEGDVIFPMVENVLVLATGKKVASELLQFDRQTARGASYHTVTLNLTPKEAAALLAAQSAGKLTAILRNRTDLSIAKFGNVRPSDIYSIAQAIAADRAPKELEVVRDKDGNIIGRVVDGKVVDADGKEIGKVVDGKVVDANGNEIGSVNKETLSTEMAKSLGVSESELNGANAEAIARLVDFLSGGNSHNGIAIVQKMPVH